MKPLEPWELSETEVNTLFVQLEGSKTRSRKKWEAKQAAIKSRKIPKGTGSPNAYRCSQALPPPHIRVPKGIDRSDCSLFREQQLASSLGRGFRDVSCLPWWAWVVAKKCAQGDWRAEVRRLPRRLAMAVQKAAELARTPEAQRSTASLGCVLTWMAIRHPKRCGRRSNIGGLSTANLSKLTRNRSGAVYSESWIEHKNHRAKGPGDPEAGTCGALESLRQSGALKSWVPPAHLVPDFMKGDIYAFAVFTVPADTFGECPLPLLQ